MDREFAGLDQDNGLGCLGLRCPWVVDPGAKPSSLAEKGHGGVHKWRAQKNISRPCAL